MQMMNAMDWMIDVAETVLHDFKKAWGKRKTEVGKMPDDVSERVMAMDKQIETVEKEMEKLKKQDIALDRWYDDFMRTNHKGK
jgi:hypothetical protein